MVLILLNTGDKSALWLHRQLSITGIKSFAVTPDEILTNKKFRLKLQEGEYTSHLELRNGLVIEEKNVSAIINRVNYLPHLFNKTFSHTDADYVYQEWHAIYISWLHGLRKKIIFNSPIVTGLAGEQYNREEWMMLASKAGFDLLPYQNSHSSPGEYEWQNDPAAKTVFFICFQQQCRRNDSENIPAKVKEAALLLHKLSGIELIGIQLMMLKDRWWFTDATALPDLAATGDSLVPLIARQIQMKNKPVLQTE